MAFAPKLVASVGHDYLHTNKTVAQIGLDHHVGVRDIARMREREGWPKRNERVRDVPSPMRALREAAALAEAACVPAMQIDAAPDNLGSSDPPGSEPGDKEASPTLDIASAIARIENLVQREIAAEERERARLGGLPRDSVDAARCAQRLWTLTQTLYALARLRGSSAEPEQGSSNVDDIPTDIDEFRRALARRIEACLESREADGGAERPAEPAMADEAE